jgi:hypothetical protein
MGSPGGGVMPCLWHRRRWLSSHASLAITLLELNDRLFRETYDRLWDKDEKLYARDDSYLIDSKGKESESERQKGFWSRGNGWVVGASFGYEGTAERSPKRDFYLDQYK